MDLRFRLGRSLELRASAHDRPLTSGGLLAAFEALPPGTWPDDDAARRIAGLLAHEQRLSKRLNGLPGTEHPHAWMRGARADGYQALAERSGRLLQVHLPLWWSAPLVLHQVENILTLTLPLAETREELLALALDHLPFAWRHSSRVAVRLEVQTRVYWGARAVTGMATRPSKVAGFSLCTIRSEATASTRELFELERGTPSGDTLDDGDRAPQIQRALRGGIGLLVAVPVLSFERPQRSLLGHARHWWDIALRRLGYRAVGDRDPTLADRLRRDEDWWAAQIGHLPMAWQALRRAVQHGALLRPANALAASAAAGSSVAAPAPSSAHAVLIHGGLSSVRSGFGDALRPADPAPGTPLWPGLPPLEAVHSWRFEHDSFLPLQRNVAALQSLLAPLLAGPPGRLVLLTHSRGGAVARLALPALRAAHPGWAISAVTLAGPHLGTQVFRRIGNRWHGLAGTVGLLRDLAGGVLGRDQMAELINLERALAYEVPAGFRDVEPQRMQELAGGDARRLPPGMVLVGAEWGPEGDEGLDEWLWDTLVEDLAGAEVGGDGLVARESSWGGRRLREGQQVAEVDGALLIDASPSFHTRYLAHPRTREMVAGALQRLFGIG